MYIYRNTLFNISPFSLLFLPSLSPLPPQFSLPFFFFYLFSPSYFRRMQQQVWQSAACKRPQNLFGVGRQGAVEAEG